MPLTVIATGGRPAISGKSIIGWRAARDFIWSWVPSASAKALYLGIVTALLFRAFADWSYDDPFITYRYADNLLQGLGFVYNPGIRVLSTTTPLFTLVLAAVGAVWSNLPQAANFVGAFSLALGALFLWDLANTGRQPLAGWTALLLYPTFPLLVSTLGSEIPLYLALCLGTCAWVARHEYRAAACFAALAVLTRPEALLLVFLLVLRTSLSPRDRPARSAFLLFIGLVLPWVIFAWMYFGSPLPTSLFAKQHQGSMLTSTPFASGLPLLVQSYGEHWEYLVEGLLFVLGLATLIRGPRWLAVFLGWGALYLVAYGTLGITNYFWYYATLVPVLIWGVGCGQWLLGGKLAADVAVVTHPDDTSNGRTFTNQLRSFHQAGRFALVLVLLLVLTTAQTSNLIELAQQPDQRIGIYRSVGQWLRGNTPADSTVGTLEVGIIGYYAGRRMVDFAGLLQPEVTNQLVPESTYEDAAFWVVQRYHPEFLVLREGDLPRLEASYVWQHCWPAQYFPGASYGYETDLSVYVCPANSSGGAH